MNKSKFGGAYIGELEKRIEEGLVFEASSLLSVDNAGGIGQWLVSTGDIDAIVHARKITTNGNEITYQAYLNPVVAAAGSLVQVTNRSGDSKTSNLLSLFSAPTITSKGTPLPPIYMPGSTGIGSATTSQFDQDGLVRILSRNSDYLIEVTNNGAEDPANIELYLLWAELNNPAPFGS